MPMPLTDDLPARFALAALATWRVTHLLANEDGPADLVFHLRLRLGESWVGGLMDCFNCLSFWVAVPAAFFVTGGFSITGPASWPVSWLALSGAACLLEKLSQARAAGTGDQSLEGDQDVLR